MISMPCLAGPLATEILTTESILADAQHHEVSDLFRQPSSRECLEFESLVLDLLMAHDDGNPEPFHALNLRADKLGFTIERYPETFDQTVRTVTVLREKESVRMGAGIYFFAGTAGKTRPAIIECPHARSDTFTGRIGTAVFMQGEVDALFCSTMRRNTPSMPQSFATDAETPAPTALPSGHIPGEVPENNEEDSAAESTESESAETGPLPPYGPADPAHNASSFFQIVHRTWMQRHPSSLVIQLHGFKLDPDASADRCFDLIISDGRKPGTPPLFLLESERILSQCLPQVRTGLFGRDTSEFGALLNVQGQYVNRYSAGFFCHIEMERGFRDKLMENPTLKHLFASCINRLIQAYETM